MKRFLSFVLALCILCGSVTCAVFAADELTEAEEPAKAEFKYSDEDGCAVIESVSFEGESFVIPEELDGLPVTGIADFALEGCSASKIVIPASVDSIGGSALNSASLAEISVAEGNAAYSSYDGILYNADKTVLVKAPQAKSAVSDIPEDVIVIGEGAFFNSQIAEFPVCESVTSIGSMAFAYSKIKSAPLTDYVTSIGSYAFAGCEELETAVLPKGIDTVPEAAFSGCRALGSVTIPASVKTIGARAYYDTAIKDKIYIPATVTEIGEYAFGWYFENDVEFVKCEGFTVWGEEGSAAETYAAENGFAFVNTKLDTPELVDVSADNTCATVYWEGVERADSYIVYKKTNGASWKRIAVVGADEECTYCDFDVADGNVYTYTVKASMQGFVSAYDKTGLTVEFIKLPVPELTGAKAEGGAITVSWKNIPAAKGYTLYRRTADTEWNELSELAAGKTSYTDKNIELGVKYYYTLTAFRGEIISGYDAAGVSATYVISAPVLVSAANATNGITVNWKASANADSYYIYRKTSGGSWSRLASVGGSTLSYTDKTAKGGTTYIYTVASVLGGVKGQYDKKGISCKYIESPKLVIKNTSEGINISWKKCAGAACYRIYIKGADGKWQKLATSKNADILSYNDRTVKSGQKYTYTVKSLNGSDASAFEKAGVTSLYLSEPDIEVVRSTTVGVITKWNKVEGAKSYYVYRKTPGGSWQRIATVSSSSPLNIADKTAVKGKTYVYTVKAVNGSYSSTYNKGISCKVNY